MGIRFERAAVRVFVIVAAFWLPSSALWPDLVVLKDGRQFKGVVLDDGGPKINVKTEILDVAIERERVERVDYDSPPDLFTRRGEELLRLGDIPGARNAFRQALEMDAEDARAQAGLMKIEKLSPDQLRNLNIERRQALANSLHKQALFFLDHSMRDEALAALEQAAQADSQNVAVVLLGAQTALDLWGDSHIPEAEFDEFLAQLKHVAPNNPEIFNLERKHQMVAQKRDAQTEADRQALLGEILEANDRGEYTRELLYKIDRIMEMKPDESIKSALVEIQGAIERAGIQRGKFSIHEGSAATPAP